MLRRSHSLSPVPVWVRMSDRSGMLVGHCQDASRPVPKALGIARRRDDGHLAFHRYADADGQDGRVPLMAELRRAAASARKIATETVDLPKMSRDEGSG